MKTRLPRKSNTASKPGCSVRTLKHSSHGKKWEKLVVKGRHQLPFSPHVSNYAAFADVSGGKHDDAALAIAHKVHDHKVVLDFIERYPAPHNPHEIVTLMVNALHEYGLDTCIGDAYAAEWTRLAFQSHGIRYENATTSIWNDGYSPLSPVAKPKSVLYAELLPRLYSGDVEILEVDILISQLSSLQRRVRSGSRDSIDHPPNGHDDVANAFAGAVDAAHQVVPVVGVFDLGEDDYEDEDEPWKHIMRLCGRI